MHSALLDRNKPVIGFMLKAIKRHVTL